MYLQEIINRIEQAAAAQPAVKMIVRGDVYKLNAEPAAEYGAFAWTQRQHAEDIDGFQRWRFVLFYVDRLSDDKSNAVQAQSVGCAVLSNIVRTLVASGELDAGEWTIDTFTERFADECAGAYTTITFETEASETCETEFKPITKRII